MTLPQNSNAGESPPPPAVEPKTSPVVGEAGPDAEGAGPIPGGGYQKVPMVGLGGSAGSFSALQSFFKRMPDDSGMVFVVVLHLSPDHESIQAELLQRATTMPVVAATDGV